MKYKMINKVRIGLIMGMVFVSTPPTSSKISPPTVPVSHTFLDSTSFSEANLIHHLKEMNFKFAHIVFAQSILETGNFNSLTFLEGNNLFGMKRATGRITTSIGDYGGYALYKSWLDSLIDYGFYQSKYLSRVNNEKEYYEKLQSNYASDPYYISKLQKIIESRQLKLLFKKL